ncbi:hypothetical protein UFOVP1229_20 [uncultured Caudovirales phage]|uniref:Uncharacterized protein n=1 Tax=uncultured Caudovirales phage TaxID=2100421 RepID=A0A6J5RC64_9CAUD|nr:hypothetical protein UFOVP1229_20 [uncultured Caudovirales phage]
MRPIDILTREVLNDMYVRQRMSMQEIAEHFGIRFRSTVAKAMVRHGIESRRFGDFAGNPRPWMNKGHGDISGSYWCSLRNGANSRELEFSIDPEYAWAVFVEQNGECALSGVPVVLVKRRHLMLSGIAEQTASLDRIDSSKGYVQGNVQWIHKALQGMKMSMPDAVFIEWCNSVSRHQRGFSDNED